MIDAVRDDMRTGGQEKMPQRTTYLNGIRPLLVGLLLLAGWLSVQLWQAGAREQALFRISVTVSPAESGGYAASGSFGQSGQSSQSGEFSGEILKRMDSLPGLRRRWAFYCADVEIEIDRYHTAAELFGIELDEYPLTIVKSAGEKQAGLRPTLIVGEGFFDRLSDEYENPISERQAKILKEQIASLAVRLAVQDVAGVGESGGEAGYVTGNKGKDVFQDAEFLGIAEGDGIYMDADRMNRWLAQMGLPCEIRRVELEIQGERNVQKAQQSLEKAGFAVLTAS